MQLDPGSTSPSPKGQRGNQTANPNEEVINGTISGVEESNHSQELYSLPDESNPELPTKPTIIFGGNTTTSTEPEAAPLQQNSTSHPRSGSEIVFSLLLIVLSFVCFILI